MGDTFKLAKRIRRVWSVPVFPVLITWDEKRKKFRKTPLARWAHCPPLDDNAPWGRANAVGVPMGERSGLITIDRDDYKEGSDDAAWFAKHNMPETLTHSTRSGGRHYIFEYPEDVTLTNVAPKEHGIDVRGQGGYIVWADLLGHYQTVVDVEPVPLPSSVLAELTELNRDAATRALKDIRVPDPRNIRPDLQGRLVEACRSMKNTLLRRRLLQGSTEGLGDKSKSAMDMSVASLMASAGFNYEEIVMILMDHFEHGVMARDGWTDMSERSVLRCATRAIEQHENRTAQRSDVVAAAAASMHQIGAQLKGLST
ncbi:hypothetical protein C1J05_17875 [Sulfitobacter sp. JL08]|uniref:bifunctional DNA primase/polymerase n=1 Tax=Sulfitobacter sp. JL08 TaxID=2070369 RepID=UPI000E0BB3B6|nr:bifunctional DNA primase/polymerase [Sulfitobacter sp. JL08]AXI56116.1 hypothetical protein C1J05_17875 [Sulfitobacter sp. JL08]